MKPRNACAPPARWSGSRAAACLTIAKISVSNRIAGRCNLIFAYWRRSYAHACHNC